MKLRHTISIGITSMVTLLLPAFVFAVTTMPTISGGSALDNAGQMDSSLLGKTVNIDRHLTPGAMMYVKLPIVLPGQAFTLKIKTTNYITVDSEGTVTVLDGSGPANVKVLNRSGEEFCAIQDLSGPVDTTCSSRSFPSDQPAYEFYLFLWGEGRNPGWGVSKDIQITFSTVDRADDAVGDTDASKEFDNTIQIEPGEYHGWLSARDYSDIYRMEGLSDGAILTVTAQFRREEGTTSHELELSVYGPTKAIAASTYNFGPGVIKELSVPISVAQTVLGALPPKTTRYIEIRLVSTTFNPDQSYYYTLDISATKYRCAGFPDVLGNDARCPAVSLMQEKGIITGTGDGRFEGNRVLNRAEFAAVILRFIEKEPLSNNILGNLTDFNDISTADKGKWWVGVIKKAVELNIIKGFTDNTMRPGDPVNRAQFVVIFTRSLNLEVPIAKSNPANDVKISDSATSWYRNSVEYVVKNDLFDLDRNNNFKPTAGITRFEVADMLYRYFQQNPE